MSQSWRAVCLRRALTSAAQQAERSHQGLTALALLPFCRQSAGIRKAGHGVTVDEDQLVVELQDTFVGPTFAADGNKWLGSPQATLMGMYNGNMSSTILQLDA